MTDRAPRPEGMSERRLAELKLAVAPGATTYDGIDPNGRCLTCGQQPCECEIGMLRDAIREIERLRADGATLRERVKELERRSGVMNVCVVCKQRKPVCCGFDENARDLCDPLHPGRDFPGPSWCADCCPQHAKASAPKDDK